MKPSCRKFLQLGFWLRIFSVLQMGFAVRKDGRHLSFAFVLALAKPCRYLLLVEHVFFKL